MTATSFMEATLNRRLPSMNSSGVQRLVARTALTVLCVIGLTAGTAGVATPAFAAASGCGVWRWTTPPSTTYNTGGATCASLTNGSQVRVVVHCGNTIFPPRYGAWVSRPNTYSSVNCGGNEAVEIDWRTR